MTNRENPWKKLSSNIVHKNKWYYVRQDQVITPDGKPGEYNVVVSPDAVCIVAIDADNNVHLIGLYRYTTDVYSIEIPAGGSEGQDPLVAAKRELEEELGMEANRWEQIGKLQSANGILAEHMYVYLARDLATTANHHQKEEGINEVITMPLSKALAMARDGEITCSQTISSLYLAAAKLGEL